MDDVGGEDRLKDLLHIIFGLSKDFCASGLRFGALHRCGRKVWMVRMCGRMEMKM